jgi:hypothetical protein
MVSNTDGGLTGCFLSPRRMGKVAESRMGSLPSAPSVHLLTLRGSGSGLQNSKLRRPPKKDDLVGFAVLQA